MYCNEELRNNTCRHERNRRCLAAIICVLTALFFFVVGTLAGAYAALFVVLSTVPITIFAIILLIGIIIALWLRHCRACD